MKRQGLSPLLPTGSFAVAELKYLFQIIIGSGRRLQQHGRKALKILLSKALHTHTHSGDSVPRGRPARRAGRYSLDPLVGRPELPGLR